jgi:ABC-2 type transport system permease protein
VADPGATGYVRPGLRALLGPKLTSKWNRTSRREGGTVRFAFLGVLALGFWALLFSLIYRMLLYFRGAEGIGDLLAGKLLGIAFLTFLMILLLSNVITALSTFFLSRDLDLLLAAPVDPLHVYWARLVESLVNSSWMVVLLVVPLLAAYGVMYGAAPGFWLLSAVVLAGFLVLPAVAGSALTLVLVNVFPARRTRDLLALIGLLAAAGLVMLVRLLQPERLVRPDEFRSLVDFMAVLRTPTSPWLPSEWAASTLLTFLTGRWDAFPLVLLLSTAAAAVVLGGLLHLRAFPSGYSKAQEGAEQREGRERSRRLERLVPVRSPAVRQLVAKEIRVFFRDSTQWSQLILLGVLVVVYVYNIRVLPLGRTADVSFLLVNVIGFLNLGLAGFVVAAIAARFVFPAMSLEGRMTWLLRSSPLEPRTLFWTKYAVGTVPLLAVALPLIVLTNLALDVSPFLFRVSVLAMVGATLAITAMALALGALFPNHETENPAEIPTSFGGLLFMMSAVVYLIALVALCGWPVYHVLRARLPLVAGASGGSAAGFVGEGGLATLVGFGGATLLTAAVIALSLRAGVRRIRDAETFVGEGAA